MKSTTLFAAVAGIALSVVPMAHATQIYSFESLTNTGKPLTPLGPDGFTGNGATVTQSPVVGATSGTSSLQISTTTAQTYGGAQTPNIPTALANATTLYFDVTIVSNDPASQGYADLVPVFFSTDGELDPDLTKGTFANIDLTPGTYHLSFNMANFIDPAGGQGTAAQILANDKTLDPSDTLNSFQFTVEHGGNGTPPTSPGFTVYIDNVTDTPPTPEPASLGLLAVGAGALLRRRRA